MASILIPCADGKKLLPYRWGTWCGVIALGTAVLTSLQAIETVKETGVIGLSLEGLIILSGFAAGVGLFTRRHYGVILFFVFAGLRLLASTWSLDIVEAGIMLTLWLLIFFLPNLIYFRKRWWGLEERGLSSRLSLTQSHR